MMGHLYRKATGNSLSGPASWVRWGLEESQSMMNGISYVYGDSDMVLTCQFCVGRAQKKNNGLCQHFYLGKNCPLSSHLDAREFSSFPYVPGVPPLEVRESELR